MNFIELLPGTITVILMWVVSDLYRVNRYRFCKRKKYKCRNWMCKKYHECEYSNNSLTNQG